MAKALFRIVLLGLLASLVSGPAWAQTNNPLRAVIAPPSNTVFITETTNVVTVTLDWANVTNNFTNFVVVGFVSTNGYGTNILGTNFVGDELRINFVDTGRPPDSKSDDGVFAGRLITPTTLSATNLQLRVLVSALDLFPANPSPDDTNAPVVTSTNLVNYWVVARPQNDNLTNAFKIAGSAGGTGTGTNNYASLEAGEPRHGTPGSVASSVWWTWSAGFTTNVLIDTAGSSFRPVLGVYTGSSIAGLELVAASTNDVVNRLAANVTIDAVKGTTYRIAVAGYDTNGVGDVRLRVAPGATPDKRPPAVVITSPNREVLTGSELLAISGTAREPLAGDSGISNVVLQVNNGSLTNAFGSSSWSGLVTLKPGTNVVRAFAIDYAGNVSAPDAIVVRYMNPTNDLFISAVRLSGVGGTVSADTVGASREPGEPLHADNEGGHSVWYSFRSSTAGTLSLSTAGSSYDTLMGVYVGDQLTNLTAVASNDDAADGVKYSALTLTVLSNQLYYVAVDGYGAAAGSMVLQYTFVAPQPGQFYNVLVGALPGGTASPPSGIYPANTRATFTATPIADYQFVGWEGSAVSQLNPLTLTVSQDLDLTARFRLAATNFTDDFERGNLRQLRWVTNGAAPWFVQTNVVAAGRYAAQSGPIIHGQNTSLILVTNTRAGTGSFEVRVNSEPGWDFLEFFLNGSLLQRWSGDIAWTNFPFALPAGTNRMEWRFSKDNTFDSAQDGAYIDNVYLPLRPDDPAAVAARLTLQSLPNRSSQLTLLGAPNRTYQVDWSSDMVIWLPLVSTNTDSGTAIITDRLAPRFPIRFYRAVAQ